MLKNVKLTNYRNLGILASEIKSHGNLLVAPNGCGKTNFLESIFYSVKGTTFRPMSSNIEVIGPVHDYSKVVLTWDKSQSECVISETSNKITRKFLVNGKGVPMKKLTQRYPIILFAPHTVDLVSGEPKVRREDLDLFLSMIDGEYSSALNKYEVVLKNRNALLKNLRDYPARIRELDVWTKQLVEAAQVLFTKRKEFFKKITPFVVDIANQIFSGFDKLGIVYLPNVDSTTQDYSDVLLAKYNENKQKEIIVGKTLYGPHKDDYYLKKDDQNLRFYGSRGQQRIAAFIIKMACYSYQEKVKNIKSVLLLDDIFSELDELHRKTLGIFLEKFDGQFILTTSEASDIPKSLTNELWVITLPQITN